MKTSLTDLWLAVADDLSLECSTSVDKDVRTLVHRCNHEGESFLTITLPAFCSDFERSLELGRLEPSAFPGFRKVGMFPAFLQGFMRLVFAPNGTLLDHPSSSAIRAIRQLTLLFKKVEYELSGDRVEAAKMAYIACEDELKIADQQEANWSSLRLTFSTLFSSILSKLSIEIDRFELDPKHGPGVTADRLFGNQKFLQTRWHSRLESVFPSGEYVIPSWRYHSSLPELVAPQDELPVAVKFVPKTAKSPRVIAVEPTCMQYMQQGLMRSLVPKLEGDKITSGMIGFTDQVPNQQLALRGSIHRDVATLDLSEASDRVRNSLVRYLFAPWPSVQEALDVTRSRTASFGKNDRKIRLSKFASMGSAVCFPVEAMVFLSITLHGMALAAGRRYADERFISQWRDDVRVYGDDIVCPTRFAASVISHLESYALKVNRQKSFSSGHFRESCGRDYYDGTDVTPVRLRQRLEITRDARVLASVTSTRNQFYLAGLWKSVKVLDDFLSLCDRRIVKRVPVHSNAVGCFTFLRIPPERFNNRIHIDEVKRLVVHGDSPANSLDGWAALRKCLTGDFSSPENAKHLLHSGRPLTVHLKSAWIEVA